MNKDKILNLSKQFLQTPLDNLLKGDLSLKYIYEHPLLNYPKQIAFIEDDVKYTFTQFNNMVNSAANYLKETLDSKCNKEDFVALQLPNSSTWLCFFWAILMLGYRPLLINNLLNSKETNRLLKESKASAIITNKEGIEDFISIKPIKPKINTPIKVKEHWSNTIAFCTSGTTGDSRIYVYTGKEVTYQLYSAYNINDTTDDLIHIKKDGLIRILATVPFSHIYGFVTVCLWYSFFGLTIVFPKSLGIKDLQYVCLKYKVSHIYTVPLFWDSIASGFNKILKQSSEKRRKLLLDMIAYNNKEISKKDAKLASNKCFQTKVRKNILGNNIRFCINGGSAPSKKTFRIINGLGYSLSNGYGMTEVGVSSVELSKDIIQRNKLSIGKPFANVEYKIINNEFCIRSPFIHMATLKNGEIIKTKLDNDGFFHTEDIAEVDNEENYYLKGKMKDIVIGKNGENIYLNDIEYHFKNIDNIKNICAICIKEEDDEVVAIVLETEDTIGLEEGMEISKILQEINNSIPLSLRAKYFYIAKDGLPLNSSLKVKRFELLDQLMNNKNNFISLNTTTNVDLSKFDNKEVKEKMKLVIEIFSDILRVDIDTIKPNSHVIFDLHGDSFSYMNLISNIDEELKVNIPMEMIGNINTPEQFVEYILNNK